MQRCNYFDECCAAMELLAQSGAIFIGQSVRYPSNAMFKTLRAVPMESRIEVPVFEDVQMGMSIGYALGGFLPVSCFPRMDFLLLAANQLVNHLDKIPYTPHRAKVIVRTSVGAKWPLHSGHQHTQDHSAAFRLMLKTVKVIELNCARDVMPGYKRALAAEHSCLVVERQDLYGEM
jgi:pyruvate/2-oxoglutarate/acetoin dehydrogenase E1 component